MAGRERFVQLLEVSGVDFDFDIERRGDGQAMVAAATGSRSGRLGDLVLVLGFGGGGHGSFTVWIEEFEIGMDVEAGA
jgi:hypothetical protein